jgi:hypothetical protein
VITNCDKAPATLGHISQAGVFDTSSKLSGNNEEYEYIEISSGTLDVNNLTIKETTVPYYLTSWNTIKKTLTIQEGATFYMHTAAYITVNEMGRINAVGTAAKPVKFTRLPNMGYYWKYIELSTENGSSFTNCIFEYGAKDTNDGMVYVSSGAEFTFTDCKFQNTNNYGVNIYSSKASLGGTVKGSGNTFSNCTAGNVRLYNGQTSPTLP